MDLSIYLSIHPSIHSSIHLPIHPLSIYLYQEIYYKKWLMQKEMATHSSILVWKIPWTEEPGRLQSMGLQAEDEEAHCLLTTSWRAKRAGGVIQSGSEGLRTRGLMVQVFESKNQEHQCPRVGENGRLSSSRESESTPPPLFCSVKHSVNWMTSTHTEEGHLLTQVTLAVTTDVQRDYCFRWIPWWLRR